MVHNRAVHHGAMSACCDPRGCDRVFGPRFSRHRARRYRRHGLDADSQRLVDIVTAYGVEGATVLEIGGGVGEIQVELLRRGAARATNVELVEAYEEDALAVAREAGVADRVERRFGDIAVDGSVAPGADIVLLHRVVCCYPDDEALLGAAADHARRRVVLSHPRANVVTRAFAGGVNVAQRLRGSEYRAFIHDPGAMRAVLAGRGLRPRVERSGAIWQIASAGR